MRRGKKGFLYLLFLVGFSLGLFVARVQAGHADIGHPSLERYGPHLSSRRTLPENYPSIYTLQFALPFAAVAAIIIALSMYVFYSDRRRKRLYGRDFQN